MTISLEDIKRLEAEGILSLDDITWLDDNISELEGDNEAYILEEKAAALEDMDCSLEEDSSGLCEDMT